MTEVLEKQVLAYLASGHEIADSGEYAEQHGIDHLQLVGLMKSLQSAEMILVEDIPHFRSALTEEGKGYVSAGSPEAQVFAAVPADGITMADLKAVLPPGVADIGFRQAMQNKWLGMDKSGGAPRVVRKVEGPVQDTVQRQLMAIAAGEEVPKAEAEFLQKKRKLIAPESWKTYRITRGPRFAAERKKAATDLSADMLVNDAWQAAEFKEYNFNALGAPTTGGYLHPLLKVRTQFRRIFTQMGFEEMPTNQWVESSFWNFDTLFQPQQHPARDAHDTFFLTNPASTPASNFPPEYLQRVKRVHQSGGYGSAGYGYAWRLEEAEKNLLRTHTTAVSSRMLHRLATTGFRPARYFSIDRVFRNEAVDRTHLAEFHQVEGLVCGKGVTLGDLIGTLQTFFSRLGLHRLRFKPAYNPYTEPSMEIFSYSEELGKWMEVGNSGMFRPEMLQPMGLPADVNVIAWGLSLERPTMILYGIDNIRDLFGHKVSLSMVRKNPICRLGY